MDNKETNPIRYDELDSDDLRALFKMGNKVEIILPRKMMNAYKPILLLTERIQKATLEEYNLTKWDFIRGSIRNIWIGIKYPRLSELTVFFTLDRPEYSIEMVGRDEVLVTFSKR